MGWDGIVIGHLVMGSGVSVPEPLTLNSGKSCRRDDSW